MSQSTTALPERLTQVSLNPHVYTYLDQNCGNKELKYFAKAGISSYEFSILIGWRIRSIDFENPWKYTWEQCLVECLYESKITHDSWIMNNESQVMSHR